MEQHYVLGMAHTLSTEIYARVDGFYAQGMVHNGYKEEDTYLD